MTKMCNKCGIEKNRDEFYKKPGNKLHTQCRPCLLTLNNNRAKANPSTRSEITKRYRQKNRGKVNSYIASYRAGLKTATVPWSEKQDIADMYAKCPEGFQVDHIIPLNNDSVCGLHVMANLQYLTAEDNNRKSNQWKQQK